MDRHERDIVPQADLIQMACRLRELNRDVVEKTRRLIAESHEAIEWWDEVHSQYLAEKNRKHLRV